MFGPTGSHASWSAGREARGTWRRHELRHYQIIPAQNRNPGSAGGHGGSDKSQVRL